MNLNPAGWPMAAKVAAVLGVALTAAIIAYGAVLGVPPLIAYVQHGPASSAPNGPASSAPNASLVNAYLASGSGWVNYLQWNSSGSGSLTDDTLSGTAPDEQVSSNQTPITVYVNGSEVTFSGLNPQNGTLANGALTLQVLEPDGTLGTDTFTAATQDQFNQAVAALQGQVQSDNNTAMQQEQQASQASADAAAEQAFSSAVSSLQSDAGSLDSGTQLASDVNQMKQDYGQEQSGYQIEQQQGSCSDGSMGADASQVSADSSQVDADLSSLQADVQSLQDTGNAGGGSSLTGVTNDISAVNSGLSALQGLGVSPGVDSSGALALGQKAVSDTNAAISWANQQGNGIDGQAHQLAVAAQNYESAHGC